MCPMHHLLAHANVGRTRGPLTSPVMEGFVAGVAALNRLAEASPGFVARLRDDADAQAVFGDPRPIATVSLWESAAALRAYAYEGAHADFVRRRREWFTPLDGPHVALWWTAAGALPTLADARDRLAHLAAHGPTDTAFTFASLRPAPIGAPAAPPALPA